MKTGVVAASYLDPLAVRVQSVRIGTNGRGWRRFLVFAALTKGRKGAEYVALFTYFSFEGMLGTADGFTCILILIAWLRICFAEGPRQVINALTLYSVMQANLVPTGKHAATHGHTPIVQFFVNVQILADKDKEQAAIYFGMLFTLVIWIFSAMSLLMAVVFYITFLWHHIRDGSLSRYCRRKIDTRLHRIVMVRVNRALEKDQKLPAKPDARGMKSAAHYGQPKRQPTVPVLDDQRSPQGELNRQPTIPLSDGAEILGEKPPPKQINQAGIAFTGSVLPSHPVPTDYLQREPTVPDVISNEQRLLPPSRSTTQGSVQSNTSYADNAPLISSAAPLGYGAPRSTRAILRMDHEHGQVDSRSIGRSITASSQGMQRPFIPSKPQMGLPSRQNTDMGGMGAQDFPTLPLPQVRKPMPYDITFDSMRHPPGVSVTHRTTSQEYEMHAHPPYSQMGIQPAKGRDYIAFKPNNPNNEAASLGGRLPTRNFTQPHQPPPLNYFGSNRGPPQRSGTAPLPDELSTNDKLYDAYGSSWREPRSRSNPPKPATARPGGWNGPRKSAFPHY